MPQRVDRLGSRRRARLGQRRREPILARVRRLQQLAEGQRLLQVRNLVLRDRRARLAQFAARMVTLLGQPNLPLAASLKLAAQLLKRALLLEVLVSWVGPCLG